MRILTPFIIVAGLSAASLSAPVQATLIERSFSISVSNFFDTTGSAASPFATVTGNFNVAFDNAADVNTTSAGLIVKDFTLADYQPINYAYNVSIDTLEIGTNVSPTGSGVASYNKDFSFVVRQISSDAPRVDFFLYSANHNIFQAVDYTTINSAVPECATWLMMVMSFGVIGAVMRSNRRETLSVG